MIDISKITDKQGVVVAKEQLSELLASMLEKREMVSFSFATDFETADDVKDCCCWYGIKTIKIFDEDGDNQILAIGYYGGGGTCVQEIYLEMDLFEQVEKMVNEYFTSNDIEKVALFIECEGEI